MSENTVSAPNTGFLTDPPSAMTRAEIPILDYDQRNYIGLFFAGHSCTLPEHTAPIRVPDVWSAVSGAIYQAEVLVLAKIHMLLGKKVFNREPVLEFLSMISSRYGSCEVLLGAGLVVVGCKIG